MGRLGQMMRGGKDIRCYEQAAWKARMGQETTISKIGFLQGCWRSRSKNNCPGGSDSSCRQYRTVGDMAKQSRELEFGSEQLYGGRTISSEQGGVCPISNQISQASVHVHMLDTF